MEIELGAANHQLKVFPSILFVGNCSVGSNALSMLRGFKKAGTNVNEVDSAFYDSPSRLSLRRILLKFTPRFYGIICSRLLEIQIRRSIQKWKPEILVVFKGNYVSKNILKNFRGVKVHYHPDDSSNSVNRTYIFNECEKYYDVHFTSKKHNIKEIASRTDRPVHFIWYAYDEQWHFRINQPDFVRPIFKVGFIGHCRPDRLKLIEELAITYGKDLVLSGLKWDRHYTIRKNATCFPPSYGEEFSKFIAISPLQLGLLNSDNRDQHTARSFEIPASGGLLIAQDTEEHREIFSAEGNCLFFKTSDELIEQIAWALSHPREASALAENGFMRITQAKNTWTDRALEMLEKLSD